MKKTLLCSLLFMGAIHTHAQTKRTLQPQDIYRIPMLTDPQLSPDGQWVAYVLSEVDTAKDKRVGKIWMKSWDGKQAVELTHGPDGASSPRWSPDGKYLSFTSSRESKNGSQIWLMDRRGGEGKKLTDIKGDIDEYAWSHDGQRIALVITDPENKGKEEPKTAKPIVIDRYHYKQDVKGYLDHRHSHLYVMDISTKKLDTLTRGEKEESDLAWSPDDRQIAYVSNTSTDPDHNENTDIFTVDVSGKHTTHQLTTWKGADQDPQWSPDGKHISYLRSTSDADYMMYDESLLCIMDSNTGKTSILTEKLDRPVSKHEWAKDGKSIAFLVTDDRKQYVDEVNIASHKITTLTQGERSVSNIKAHSAGKWLIQLTDPYMPAELFALENKATRRITTHQEAWLSNINLATVQGFQSKSNDGTLVSGILYKPYGYVAGKKYPLILFIHGGPVGQDGYNWDLTRQMLSAAGYAVAAVNYRGSNGRGLEYCKAIYADWGNKEVKDLLGAVDELTKEGIADPDNLGIGGWSYGGLLTDYTIASDPRFKAACSGAGSALQLSMYGSDQYVLQYETEVGAPWKNVDKWLKLSYPFFQSEKINTPVLFLSGLKDFNVPTAGGEQLYQALKSQGKKTELILYPNQFHGISVPSYQVDILNQYIGWYNKYLKN